MKAPVQHLRMPHKWVQPVPPKGNKQLKLMHEMTGGTSPQFCIKDGYFVIYFKEGREP